MSETIIEKLFLQYQQKGFLTNDEIFTELISSTVSIVQTERICSELLSRGALISDLKPQIQSAISESTFDYDKAHINYNKLYDKIVCDEPGLKFLVDYIRKIQPPQQHEVEKLYPQIQAGNNFARNRLFEMNMRTALKFAYQHAKELHLNIEDTVSDAMMGLYESIDRFDLFRHEKFPAYSTYWILNSINRNKSIEERIWRFPAYSAELQEKIYKYLQKEYKEFLFTGNITNQIVKEVAARFNISEELSLRHLLYLAPMLDCCEVEIASPDDPYIKVLERVDAKALNHFVDSLKPKERLVLKLRYGLYMETDFDYDEIVALVNDKIYKYDGCYGYGLSLTLEEVGVICGVSRERVRQIEVRSLEKLKNKLSGIYSYTW